MIKIAHLYPELLTLYGENGNIKALTKELTKNKQKYSLTNINLEDEINFSEYDFIYIGSGRPKNLELVKNHLMKYEKDILTYINSHKILLATGNALSIFDFLNLYEIEKYPEFITADIKATTPLVKEEIKGFQNTEWLIKNCDNPFIDIIEGYGNSKTTKEGYYKNNFYVTSIIGPILARNPKLNNYFVKLLISVNKDKNII